MEIEVYEFEKMDLKNAFVITGFPTVGLVGTIASRFIIHSLKLKLLASFLSDYFPPITVIFDSTPLPPIRIYGGAKKCGPNGKCEQLLVILSEFVPPFITQRPLANKLIEWCKENNCETIVCIEGFNLEEKTEDIPIVGVASTEEAKKMLLNYNVELMKEGMVSGLSGILLYEGKRRNFDVACLLAGTHADYPDAKAAAKVLEIVNKMLPEIEIDAKPLYKQAEEIEKQIKIQIEKAKPTKHVYEEPIMYR